MQLGEEKCTAQEPKAVGYQEHSSNSCFMHAGTPTVQFNKKLLLVGPAAATKCVTADTEPVVIDNDNNENKSDDSELPDFHSCTHTSTIQHSATQLLHQKQLGAGNTYDNYIELFDSDCDVDSTDINEPSSQLELHCSSEPFDSCS
jgi:hypothetical protein